MRAADILLFCLCINASIVFVNELGIMGSTERWFMPQTGTAFDNQFQDINQYDTDNISWGEMVQIAIIWLVETTLFVIRFLVQAVIIVPVLIRIFGVPAPLAVMLQVGLYFIYMWGIVQWKSGKSLFSYQ